MKKNAKSMSCLKFQDRPTEFSDGIVFGEDEPQQLGTEVQNRKRKPEICCLKIQFDYFGVGNHLDILST